MAYTKTNWVNDESPDIDADNLNKMEQGIYDAQYPDGGSEGQLLARTATGKAWVDAPNSAVWGLIQGTLSDQTDLAMALENTGKVDTVNGIQPNVLTKNVQVDVEITKQGWDALPSTKYTDDINYYIKDGTNIPQAGVISASGVQYDNTSSGLDATTVQGAIDENASEIADVKSGLNIITVTGSDGNAVKFPDGTMIFYGTKSVSLGTAATVIHIDFPVYFYGSYPTVTSSTGAGGTRTEAYIEDVNTQGFNAYFSARGATSTSWFRYIAVGRWKA